MGFSQKKLFSNASKILASSLGVTALGFLQGMIVAREFGPSEYGIWGLVMAYCGTVKAFLSFRTSEPLTRYLVQYRENDDSAAIRLLLGAAIATELATSLITTVFIFLAAPVTVRFLAVDGDSIVNAAWIFGLGQFFGFISPVFFAVSRDRKRFNIIAILPAALALMQLVTVYTLRYFRALDIVNLAWVYLGVAVIQLAANAFILRPYLLEKFSFDILRPGYRRIWAEKEKLGGFWLFMKTTYVSSMASSLLKNGDTLMLGYLAPASQVGLYRLGKNLASLANSSAASLASVIYQDLNESVVRNEVAQMLTGLKRMMRYWGPAVAAGIAVSFALSHPLIRMVYGEPFEGAHAIFNILMVGMGVATMLFWIQPLALALGKYAVYLRVVLLGSLLAIPYMGWMGGVFGAQGMAFGFASAWGLLHIVLFLSILAKGGVR